MRVLVADDQATVREGLVTLLGLAPGIEVVGAAANVFRSLQTVDDIATDLEDEETGGQQDKDRHDKVAKAVREFGGTSPRTPRP